VHQLSPIIWTSLEWLTLTDWSWFEKQFWNTWPSYNYWRWYWWLFYINCRSENETRNLV